MHIGGPMHTVAPPAAAACMARARAVGQVGLGWAGLPTHGGGHWHAHGGKGPAHHPNLHPRHALFAAARVFVKQRAVRAAGASGLLFQAAVCVM